MLCLLSSLTLLLPFVLTRFLLFLFLQVSQNTFEGPFSQITHFCNHHHHQCVWVYYFLFLNSKWQCFPLIFCLPLISTTTTTTKMGFNSSSVFVRRKMITPDKTPRSLDPQHIVVDKGGEHHFYHKHHHHYHHHQLQCLITLILLISSFFTTSPITITSAASFATSHLSQTLSASSASSSSASRVVTTKYGSLRGNLVRLTPSKGTSDHHPPQLPLVEAYLGVPYATPPTGGLRFMPPVTPSHWRGVRSATAPSAVCPQTIPADVLAAVRAPDAATAHRKVTKARHETLRRLVPLLGNQSEDCLYLNVYVPVVGGGSNNQGELIMSIISTVVSIV